MHNLCIVPSFAVYSLFLRFFVCRNLDKKFRGQHIFFLNLGILLLNMFH